MQMAAITTSSTVTLKIPAHHFSSVNTRPIGPFLGNPGDTGGMLSASFNLGDHPTKLALRFKSARRRALTLQASYSDSGKPSSASIFVGGFVLGGLIVGTLGCVYAPQISKALTGADKKDLMKKLPKFIYDEEKVLEKQRKKLAEKIEQLNSAIDNVSSQLRSEEPSTEEL